MFLVSEYIRAAGKGTCYVCRAARRSKDEVIIDLGIEIDFEGALQVCAPCIAEAAKLTGAIDDAVRAVRLELEDEILRRVEAETLLDAAERAMDAMKLYRSTPRKLRAPQAGDAE